MEKIHYMFESFRQERYAKLNEEEQQEQQSKEIKPLNIFGAISLVDTKPQNMLKAILSLTGSDLKTKFESPASMWLINVVVNAIGKNPNVGDAVNSIESTIKGDNLSINIKGKDGSASLNITKNDISKLGDSENILDIAIAPKEAMPENVNVESKLGNFLLYTPLGSVKGDNVGGSYASAFDFCKNATSGKTFMESVKSNEFINDLNSAFKGNMKDNKYLSVLKDIKKYEDKEGYLKGEKKQAFVDSLSKGSDLASILNIKAEEAPESTSTPDSGTTVATEE